MGSYQRRGHWRRGRNGQRHWVSTHQVSRRSGYSSAFYSPPPPRWTPAPRLPAAFHPVERRLVPNARCPVCGALTFFYSNGYGSRVYFDALGPPWPKHPCVDSSAAASPFPMGRPGPQTHEPWVVVTLWAHDGGTQLHLHPLNAPGHISVWRTLDPVALRPGHLVFMRDGRISYFDDARFGVAEAAVTFIAMLPRPESPLLRFLRRMVGAGR